MHDVIIEVHDVEPEVAALRGAMPELFAAAAIVEAGAAVMVGARERAVEDLVAVEKIAEGAGWTAEQLAELRAEVERAKDEIGGCNPTVAPSRRERRPQQPSSRRGSGWNRTRASLPRHHLCPCPRRPASTARRRTQLAGRC